MKVFLLGAGRRITLAQYLMKAGFEIFAYDTEENAPIKLLASVINGKKWDDPQLDTHLIELNKKYNFDLIIPLMDPATVALTRIIKHSPELKCKVPTSDGYSNNICLNKKLFEDKFKTKSFYPSVHPGYSVIMKPIFGANSRGLKIISFDEYQSHIIYEAHAGGHYRVVHNANDSQYISQRYIPGGIEYSVDAYFNKNGKMVDAVPRKRLEVQGGEVSRSITMDRNYLGMGDLTREVGEELGLVGPACCQFIVDNTERPLIMEMNARFGGGVTLSLAAGFNMINLLKQEYIDNKIAEVKDYNWKSGYGMIRYFSETYYEA
jgi:carbamoyl-phosphate synthase large subunit